MDTSAGRTTVESIASAPRRTAVLVVDMQNDFVHPSGKCALSGMPIRDADQVADAINRLVDAARGHGARPVFIRVEHGLRVDNPAYRARYAARGMDPADPLCAEGTWGAEPYARVRRPAEGEPTFIKHGYDAFHADGLDDYLRGEGIETVVVTGVVTNLCVLGTAAGAFERGYHVVVPRECTAAATLREKEWAEECLARWYGQVVDLDTLLHSWDPPSGEE